MHRRRHHRSTSPTSRYALGIAVTLVTVLAALLLTSASPADARDPLFSCFFAGTTTNGNIFVATSHEDISGSNRVVLYGVRIPPQAESAFGKYVQKMLGGYLLHVRVKRRVEGGSIPTMVGEVMVVQGSTYVNFNKAVLRDGYGELANDAPASYQSFSQYARAKGLGIWASGRPRWIIPQVAREETMTGAVTDRDKTIERYGIPNYTNRTQIPDNYSILQYHIYITDFYLSTGQVFIYRDGKLVNRQAMGK
ncbi:MAG: hypothetical protein EB084_20185 [Proteobacteria bacterium]|nr:hypothetical protein [Pseudomonadota bacterium]